MWLIVLTNLFAHHVMYFLLMNTIIDYFIHVWEKTHYLAKKCRLATLLEYKENPNSLEK